jgi:hypothetical protein
MTCICPAVGGSSTDLVVVELADNFANEAEAGRVIETESSPALSPRFYEEWVGEQYFPDKNAVANIIIMINREPIP